MLSLAAAATPVAAQVAATVDGVQMPAWLVRDGARTPLTPGMALRAGDEVHAGGSARVVIRLAEGSIVRLGENGKLRFVELNPVAEAFKAALNVLEGAFRFTTDIVARNRRRDVSFRISSVTAGIRGTDVWGRSRPGNEIVCLIEGAVEVGADGEPPVTMDQPLLFYRRVQGATQPVGVVDGAQLKQWAAETDLEAGKGVARAGGQFGVLVGTVDDQAGARVLYERVRAAGYPAEILAVRQGEKVAYSVRVRSLASQADARAIAERLRNEQDIPDARATQ